jgi:hypothetical protein
MALVKQQAQSLLEEFSSKMQVTWWTQKWHNSMRSDSTQRRGDTTRPGSHLSVVREAIGGSGSPTETWSWRKRRDQHHRGEATEINRARTLVQPQREILVRMAEDRQGRQHTSADALSRRLHSLPKSRTAVRQSEGKS